MELRGCGQLNTQFLLIPPLAKVSLMLEEGFAAAARLNTMGFPVGVQLASRLVPDVSYFLTTYVDNVSQMISQVFSV